MTTIFGNAMELPSLNQTSIHTGSVQSLAEVDDISEPIPRDKSRSYPHVSSRKFLSAEILISDSRVAASTEESEQQTSTTQQALDNTASPDATTTTSTDIRRPRYSQDDDMVGRNRRIHSSDRAGRTLARVVVCDKSRKAYRAPTRLESLNRLNGSSNGQATVSPTHSPRKQRSVVADLDISMLQSRLQALNAGK